MSYPPYLVRIALAITLLLLGDAVAHAQIEVAPTRVLLSRRQRSAEVTVHNPTNDPVEVNTDLGFKLIKSDSLGKITLQPGGSTDELRRSCRDWVKIFPYRFTIPPNSSRTVRIMALPPDTLAEGEYWGRAVFGCTPMKDAVAALADTTSTIRTNVTMRLEFDIPIIFRVGTPATGIGFDSLMLRRNGERTLGLLDVTRSGNSAYRGTLAARLLDAEGKELAKVEEQYTVEFSLRKTIDLPPLASGLYTLEIESKSVKKGAANDAVIAAPTVRKVYALTVSASGIESSVRE